MTVAKRAAARVYDELMTRVGEANPRPRIEPVRRLAELAGSPQLSYPVIQVAGTNGKTSTSRTIASLLQAHGLRTGLFTSPHLIDFTERFQLDGEPVNGEVLAEAWSELQLPLQVVDTELAAQGLGPITFFEALAVLAFAIFADAPVEVAVIEVGMGGEWDATNIADAQVAVFTPVDLDHTEILGHEIGTIARTKAGIIKPGATVVTSLQHDDALAAIEQRAEQVGAQIYAFGRDFDLLHDALAIGGRQLTVRSIAGLTYPPTYVPLHGQYQAENVTLGIAAVEAFFGVDRPLPAEVVEEGLGTVTSPGRLQRIASEPSVYIDAAHNPHGAEALTRAVAESFGFDELMLVVGALAEKDVAGVCAALAPIANAVILVPVDSPRNVEVDRLTEVALEAFAEPVQVAETLSEGLREARAWAVAESGRAVLVVGSVLLAGQTLELSRKEGWGSA